MFTSGTIVKVLVSNIPNSGYDYRLTGPADIGTFVCVTVMNRPYIGIVWGVGDSGLPSEKIKPVSKIFENKLNITDLQWLRRMSDWTLMPLGMALRLIINVPDAFLPPPLETLYIYNHDAQTRMTTNRQSVMDAFSANDNEAMTTSDIQNISGVSSSVVRTMIDKGLLIASGTQAKNYLDFSIEYQDSGDIKLNQEQQIAADAIGESVGRGGFSVFLLDGVTGSGKTQVYFDAAWRAYSAGKSVLLMMPEIALTAQFMHRFAARFGSAPVVWHSNLTAARRRAIWRGVLNGEIRMVVGTRSALFLPWTDLGLIVIDEEHDTS